MQLPLCPWPIVFNVPVLLWILSQTDPEKGCVKAYKGGAKNKQTTKNPAGGRASDKGKSRWPMTNMLQSYIPLWATGSHSHGETRRNSIKHIPGSYSTQGQGTWDVYIATHAFGAALGKNCQAKPYRYWHLDLWHRTLKRQEWATNRVCYNAPRRPPELLPSLDDTLYWTLCRSFCSKVKAIYDSIMKPLKDRFWLTVSSFWKEKNTVRTLFHCVFISHQT